MLEKKKAMFLIKSAPTFQETIDHIQEYHFPRPEEELRFMPDNYVELTLNLGAPIARNLVGSIRPIEIKTGELLLSSCRSKGMILNGENIHLVSAKIPAQYTRLFFDDSSGVERDQVVSMGHFPSIGSKDQFEIHLKSWMKELPPFKPNFMMDEALQIMRSTNGEVKVKEVNEQLGVSKSHMEQRFSFEIGLSPKEFCKIEKLKHFLNNYRQYQDIMNLTQLTFQSGYYDQSHLIKEFRYFMDVRPKDFMRMSGLTF